LNSLVREIAIHSVAVEVAIYPLLEKKLSSDTAKHSREEHQLVKNNLYQIDRMDMNDPSLDSLLKQTMSAFMRSLSLVLAPSG
jgi:hypothetical protein